MTLRFRILRVRLVHEWQRFGNPGPLFRRLVQVVQEEGWQGLQGRFRGLLRPAGQTIASSPDVLPTAAEPTDGTPTEALQPGVFLIGHPFDVLGVGENLRSTATALDRSHIPFDIRDAFGHGSGRSRAMKNFAYAGKVVDSGRRRRGNIFCLNANEMDVASTYLGHELFEDTYNIGCWMWELSEFPRQWSGSFRYVQEIWAQSRFVQESIGRKAPVPVVWMPQVVEPGPADPRLARTLGVPTDRFTFLFFFDFSSYVARKNPGAVIEAFRRAFPRDVNEPLTLVIKLNGGEKRIADYQRFLRDIEDLDERVVLIDSVLDDQRMKGLISACDVFVSLHRSEGFGRGLAEAMYYGKATIATAYSGNMDFTNHLNSCLVDYRLVPVGRGQYPFWKDQFWAEPSTEHAAYWMRRLFEDRAFHQDIGACAARSIRSTHGAKAAGDRMRERLNALELL